jgi:hypothetical protein
MRHIEALFNQRLMSEIKDILSYDMETGEFRWKINRGGFAKAGTMAGSIDTHGYRQIMLQRKLYLAHRLAWFYVTGEWPKYQIDHIDGDRTNNRFANLRDVIKITNVQNQKSAHSNNKSSGLLGVSWRADIGKWVAGIRISGKRKSLGHFTSKEEAHAAYITAKRKYHHGCTL